MNKYYKFGFLTVAILGVLGWLAIGGINQSKTYYKTVEELSQMGHDGVDKRLRVGGDVVANSIQRNGHEVYFTIAEIGREKPQLKVVYSGIDPLPDTFKDGAQALADGKLGSDGVFHATKIQAKCASKYEAKPMQNPASRS
jgi:cytochrome c-type biogenesis protein CcmE